MSTIDLSVVIPQRNSLDSLPRLFSSIPEASNIEIILVDNSPEPITKEQVGVNRDYTLCWSSPDRFAGGARNEGIRHAHGKWIVFADADDYFTPRAFSIFLEHVPSDADVVYFSADGIYPDTGERSNKADGYTRLVQDYIKNPEKDTDIRISFHVPWAKMVNRAYVEANQFKFDEVVANNDDYFAMLVGFYARKIEAYDEKVYMYTVAHGSLMHRRSYDVIKARFIVILRKNKFLKEHNLKHKQGSIMYLYSESRKYGAKQVLEFTGLLLKYHQNPFIGWKNWLKTLSSENNVDKKDKRYITQ